MPDITPYPGLRPFQSEEDYLFFGREEQIADLTQRLQQHRFVAVVGSSGSGKSSLVRCGLLSQLQGGMMVGAGSNWQIAVTQPGGDPLGNLAQSLIAAELYDEDEPDIEHHVMATINRSTNGLVEAVKQGALERGSNILLVVDQFEEIFRFHEAGNRGEEQAPDFIRWLIHAVKQDEVPIYIVLTMRSDFLGDCARFTGLAEAINDGEYLVPKLTRDQIQQAIEGPARVAGGNVSRRLIQRLLNDVGEHADQLPVLQHALMRTWDQAAMRLVDSDTRELDLEDYESIGGMANALSTHADEILSEIKVSAEDAERSALTTERLFKSLTEKGVDSRGIRRPTRISDLTRITDASSEEILGIIEAYRAPGRTFLMPGVGTSLEPDTVIDISHESLMRVWSRLDNWVEEESQSVRIYQRLSETAQLWNDGNAGLYRDPDLQIASSWVNTTNPNEAWASRYNSNFQLALRFLETSDREQNEAQRKAEEQRKRELEQAQQLADEQQLRAEEQAASVRRFRKQSRIIAGVACLAIAATVVAILAMFNAWEKEKEALIAQNIAEQARIEMAAAFRDSDIAQARQLFKNGAPHQALAILKTAFTRNPEDKELIRVGLEGLIQQNQFVKQDSSHSPHSADKIFTFNVPYIYATSSSDGWLTYRHSLKTEKIGDEPNNLRSVKLNDLVLECTLVGNKIYAVTRDGSAASISTEDFSVQHFAIETGGTDTKPNPVPVQAMRLTGATLHFLDSDKIFYQNLSDVTSEPAFIQLSGIQVREYTFSEDGLYAIVTTDSNQYIIYDLKSRGTAIRTIKGDSDVQFLSYLPLQKQFIAVEQENLLCTFSPTHPDLDTVHDIKLGNVKEFVISPDSTRLGTLGFDGLFTAYHLVDGSEVFDQFSDVRQLPFNSIKFDPTGIYLLGVDAKQNAHCLDSTTGEIVAITSGLKIPEQNTSIIWNVNLTASRKFHIHLIYSNLEHDGQSEPVSYARLWLTKPYGDDALPDFDALDYSQIEQQQGERFFDASMGAFTGKGIPRLRGPLRDAFAFVYFREGNQGEVDTDIYAGNTLKDYFEKRAAANEVISLATIAASRQFSPRTFSSTLRLHDQPPETAELVTRYHLLKHAQKFLHLHRLGSDTNEIIGQTILEILSEHPNLLEARSQAFKDQIYERPAVDLLSPANIGSWEGLTHVWQVTNEGISTYESKYALNHTGNQYIVWNGSEYSDVKLSFKYKVENGNSGVNVRGKPATDARMVYGANRIHPFLREGYQPDFLAYYPSNGQFESFMGSTIVDNSHDGRKTMLTKRGSTNLITQSDESIPLNRADYLPTTELIEALTPSVDGFSDATVVFRGNRIDTYFQNTHTSTTFDDHPLAYKSGDISFQRQTYQSTITIKQIEVITIGRDLAEAENEISRNPATNHMLVSKLLNRRKRWNQCALALESLLKSPEHTKEATKLLREVNLTRHYFHQQLIKACRENNVDHAKALIEQINDTETLGQIAYQKTGNFQVQNILEEPMGDAAFAGSSDVVELLLKNGVSLSLSHSLDPIMASALANQPDVARVLIKYGYDLDGASDFPVIHQAAKWAGPEFIRILLDAGADANSINSYGKTALLELAQMKALSQQFGNNELAAFTSGPRRIEVAKLLVKAGCSPLYRGRFNRNPIEEANFNGDTELANLLEELAKDLPEEPE